MVSDITEFKTEKTLDVWHDRATFHFLTTTDQISKYFARAKDNVKGNGFLIIDTFSEKGPDKCSGLEIKKYSEESLIGQLKGEFEKIKCITEDHKTPFYTLQNFLFCSFKRSTIYHALN